MKQILAMDWALIDNDTILNHPTTIFTNDNIPVETFATEEELVTAVASKDVNMYPEIPNVGEKCEYFKIYKYGTDKAKCLQEHNRTIYPIEQTPALWLIIPTVETYPVWVQPTGAQDAYQKGDRVYFPTANDSVYESLLDANVWSPTAYPAAWKLV